MYIVTKITVLDNKVWKVLPLNIETDDEIVDDAYLSYQMGSLVNDYYECLITYRLTDSILDHQVRIADVPYNSFTDYETYIEDHFENLFNTPGFEFKELSTIRSIRRPKAIKYFDLWNFGFHAEKGVYAKGVNVLNEDGNDRDIFITRKTNSKTPLQYKNELLYMAGGKVFFPEYVGSDVYLRNSFKTLNKNNRTQLGVIDFSAVGGFSLEVLNDNILSVLSSDNIKTRLKAFPITRIFDYYLPGNEIPTLYSSKLVDSIYYVKVNDQIIKSTSFKVLLDSNKDIFTTDTNTVVVTASNAKRLYRKKSKSVFLITNGILHRLNHLYNVNDDDTVTFNLQHRWMVGLAETPWEERDWISPTRKDYSAFNMSTVNAVNYLSRGNSALLFVDVANMAVNEETLEYSGIPGQFLTYRVPKGIMWNSDGTVSDYVISDFDYARVAINCSLPRLNNNIIQSVHPSQITTMDHSRIPHPRKDNRTAMMIDYYTI